MEISYYDVAIEGTSLTECRYPDSSGKTIVFDQNTNYGSTYDSVEKLCKSKYVRNTAVLKEEPGKIIIEAFPCIFSSYSILNEFTSSDFLRNSLDFINISTFAFIENNGKFVKVPYTKTEIIECPRISKSEKFQLFSAIKLASFSEISEFLLREFEKNKNETFLYKIFCKHRIFDEESFKKFALSFGDIPYGYPKHGMSSVVESMCFVKAVRGYNYLVNETIKYSEQEDGEYKWAIECPLGKILCKEIIKQDLPAKRSYIRVVETKEEILDGNFILFLETKSECLKILGLNNASGVCGKNKQLLYFISEKAMPDISSVKSMYLNDLYITKNITFEVPFEFKILD